MRYAAIVGLMLFAYEAAVAAPVYVTPQTATRKVEPQDTRTSDTDITRLVQERLWKSVELRNVEVHTDRGVVILTGNVPSVGASARASGIARKVLRVRLVKNKLTHDPANGQRHPSAGIGPGSGAGELGSGGTSLEAL